MQKGLPASLAAAWGIRERPGKGPKPGLSLRRIVNAAVAVASSDGLDAVSMSRVAGELDAATMSLYRHVSSKDELLALMMDAVFATPPAAPKAGEAWHASLSHWARAHLAVLRRYPWVVRIPLNGPPILPNQVVWFERALAGLAGTGLTAAEQLSALLLVNGFVRNEALLTADLQMAVRTSGSTLEQAVSSYARLLAQLIDAERFPAISAVIATGVFDRPGGADDDFDFGLARILDGIAALVEKRSSRTPRAKPRRARSPARPVRRRG